MNARPAVRDALIKRKMLHWREIARFKCHGHICPPWQARKNYWRLIARYPEIAASLGFTAASVYL
jgi:hypothetical protein